MAMLDVNCCTQPSNILCDEITEYDGAHGGFARAALPHQENFLLPFAGIHPDTWKTTLSVRVTGVFLVVGGMLFFGLMYSIELISVAESPGPTMSTESVRRIGGAQA